MIDTASLADMMHCRDVSSWSELLYKLARGQGFDRVLYGVTHSRHSRFDSAFLRSNYSSEWRERYDRKGFAHLDPVVGHCMTSSLPIVWEPATFAEPAQRAMYEEASEFGIRSGVTLPVHGPQGEFGVLSFASDAEPDEAFRKSVAAVLPGLSLIRDYAFASSALVAEKLLHNDVMIGLLQASRLDAVRRQVVDDRVRIRHHDGGVRGDDELGALLHQFVYARKHSHLAKRR